VVGKSTEYAEGHEEIEKDGESDTEMTAAQGTCVTGTREHRVTYNQKNTVLKVIEDTLIRRIENYWLVTSTRILRGPHTWT
jgi:hypothetical protein